MCKVTNAGRQEKGQCLAISNKNTGSESCCWGVEKNCYKNTVILQVVRDHKVIKVKTTAIKMKTVEKKIENRIRGETDGSSQNLEIFEEH